MLALALIAGWAAADEGVKAQVPVPAGSYAPLYPADPAQPRAQVASFHLDRTPVTRAEYAAFVREHPEWRRGSATPLFVDGSYLSSWRDDLTPPTPDQAAVTEVSWFAARAYCAAQGQRLPTEHEWEYAARASDTLADASDDPEWLARILGWYGAPNSEAPVGSGTANVFGVHDLHGLVWEWVDDFNNTLFGTDGRESGDEDQLRFCGSGALSATDVRDYASFMRVAFRSSLEGRYTTRNLGFRCASDLETP